MASDPHTLETASTSGRVLSAADSPGSAEIPITNIYYLLCYAWDVLEEKETLAEARMRWIPLTSSTYSPVFW